MRSWSPARSSTRSRSVRRTCGCRWPTCSPAPRPRCAAWGCGSGARENPDRLSGGGRQRLAIACALAMGSPLLVLDEPTANLDPRGIEEVYAALGRARRSGRPRDPARRAQPRRGDRLRRPRRRARSGGPARGGRHRSTPCCATAPTSCMRWACGCRSPRSPRCACAAPGSALEPLPLTPAELRAALEAAPAGRRRPSKRRSASLDEPGPDERSPSRVDERIVADDRSRSGTRSSTVRGLTLRRGRSDSAARHRPRRAAAASSSPSSARTAPARRRLIQAIAGVIPPPRGTVHVGGPRRRPQRLAHALVAHRVRLPEPRAPVHRAHRVRRDRARPAAAAPARRRGPRAHRGAARAIRAHRQGPDRTRSSSPAARSVGSRSAPRSSPARRCSHSTSRRSGRIAPAPTSCWRSCASSTDEGTTILVVTHDMQLVAEYADRTVVLADGRVARPRRNRRGLRRRRPHRAGRAPAAAAARVRCAA